ncbi:hypothetical protein E2320_005633 [Naja naja]|nr:hypothetical protein E2320_005633 [Naja naja]
MSSSKKKSVKMIIIVMLVFIICFLPFHITRTLYYSFRSWDLSCPTLDAINLAYKLCRPLASTNSCLDPILYFLAGQKFVKFTCPQTAAKNGTQLGTSSVPRCNFQGRGNLAMKTKTTVS